MNPSKTPPFGRRPLSRARLGCMVGVLVAPVLTACAESSSVGAGDASDSRAKPASVYEELESRALAYVATPEAMRSAVINIRCSWFTDVLPPGGGTTDTSWTLDGQSGRLVVSHHVEHGPAPSWRMSQFAADDVRMQIAKLLEELVAANALQSERIPPQTERGTFFAGATYDLELTVNGEHGTIETSVRMPYYLAAMPTHRKLMECMDHLSGRDSN